MIEYSFLSNMKLEVPFGKYTNKTVSDLSYIVWDAQ